MGLSFDIGDAFAVMVEKFKEMPVWAMVLLLSIAAPPAVVVGVLGLAAIVIYTILWTVWQVISWPFMWVKDKVQNRNVISEEEWKERKARKRKPATAH